MKLKTKLWLGLILIGLVAFGWYWMTRSDPRGETVTETVERGDVSETVSVSGELVPDVYADLSSQVLGVVTSVSVQEGATVRAGEMLVTLDRSVLQSQLAAARIAQRIAEENERLARRGWEDLKPEEREAKKLASEAAREDVRTVAAQLERSVIRAPFAGRITRVDIRGGETIAVGTPVMRLVRDEGLTIEARVPESDIVKLQSGMESSVTFDALDTADVFPAKITAIDPAATVVQDVVSYIVTFALERLDPRLKEGMSADVDIVTAKREQVLLVPFRALTVRGEKTYALVQNADGTTREVTVETGLEGDDGSVEILSGLNAGENIIVSAVSE